MENRRTFTKEQIKTYQREHGQKSLMSFIDLKTHELVVVKHYSADEVEIVEVSSLAERCVPQEEFDSKFSIYVVDEAFLFFGKSDAVEATNRMLDAVDEAVRHCLTVNA